MRSSPPAHERVQERTTATLPNRSFAQSDKSMNLPTLKHNCLMLTMTLTVGLGVFQPARASQAAMERVPVALTGPGCDSHENELSRALLALQGVNAAHFHRIPDHVLVDITVGMIVPEELVRHLNTAATSWQCRAEIMQSCITAAPVPQTRKDAP